MQSQTLINKSYIFNLLNLNFFNLKHKIINTILFLLNFKDITKENDWSPVMTIFSCIFFTEIPSNIIMGDIKLSHNQITCLHV